jgi:hypothetical protein
MKSDTKFFYFWIGAICVAIVTYYTYTNNLKWLLIIEIPILLFLLLRGSVGIYNYSVWYKDQQNKWEGTGNRIILYNQIVQITNSFENLSVQDLRIWLTWLTEHPTKIEAAFAFKEIISQIACSPEGSKLAPGTREEAKNILDSLSDIMQKKEIKKSRISEYAKNQ